MGRSTALVLLLITSLAVGCRNVSDTAPQSPEPMAAAKVPATVDDTGAGEGSGGLDLPADQAPADGSAPVEGGSAPPAEHTGPVVEAPPVEEPAAAAPPTAVQSEAIAGAPASTAEPALEAAAPPDLGAAPAARPVADPSTHSLSIERIRAMSFPGSELAFVQDLEPGANHSRHVVSYQSEGNTIYALLTIPSGERPPTGWPVVIFNHGYIPPAQYRTTERYVAYVNAFARNGYIVLKSDYRGHGSSEGVATGGRGTPDYTIDVLNGQAAVARHPDADPRRIGMWGHSMGGSITLRSMVVTDTIKAGVIWAGVVASYPDMYNGLGREASPNSSSTRHRRGWRLDLVELFGTPDENPAAWAAMSPNSYVGEISGPLQLHHGTADSSVPVAYSERLQEQVQAAGRESEIFIYQGDDHNLSGNLTAALNRSVEFFDRHVKSGGP